MLKKKSPLSPSVSTLSSTSLPRSNHYFQYMVEVPQTLFCILVLLLLSLWSNECISGKICTSEILTVYILIITKSLFKEVVAIYTTEESLLTPMPEHLNSLIFASKGENERTTNSFDFNFFFWVKLKNLKQDLRLYISFSVLFSSPILPNFPLDIFSKFLLLLYFFFFTYLENWLFLSVENIFSQFQHILLLCRSSLFIYSKMYQL